MAYPSDLTDEQWAYLEPLLLEREAEQRYLGGRKRTTDLRAIVNALLYRARTGCQWRYFPTDFPKSGTFPYYYDKWTHDETFLVINQLTCADLRDHTGRDPAPTATCIDTKKNKKTESTGEHGIDGGKKY